MIIKVCGMRDPENIRAVSALGVDMIGFIFCRESPRYVSLMPSNAGVIPDYLKSDMADSIKEESTCMPARVGVFVDSMPQDIITMVYNYKLDYVQLHGNEGAVLIENLRRTIVPDIRKDLKFIKTLSVSTVDDIRRWREYDGVADMFLFDTKGFSAGGNGVPFDWSILDEYDGNIPFLLSGGIGSDDACKVLALKHPMMAGIDLNSRFETSPAVKDARLLEKFIHEIRKNNH